MNRRNRRIAFALSLCFGLFAAVHALAAPPLMSAELIKDAPRQGEAYQEANEIAVAKWEAFCKENDENDGEGSDYLTASAFVSLELDGKPERAWFFAFSYIVDSTRPGLEIAVSTPSNEVIFANAFTWRERQAEWEAEKKESFKFWDVKDKALFYALYWVYPTSTMGMPGEDDLTVEQVLLIGRDTLIENGVTPEAADNTKVSVEFWNDIINGVEEYQRWILVYYDEKDNVENGSEVYQVNVEKDGTSSLVYNRYTAGEPVG